MLEMMMMMILIASYYERVTVSQRHMPCKKSSVLRWLQKHDDGDDEEKS